MAVRVVPHRPARQRPPSPPAEPLQLARPPAAAPPGPGWLAGVLPAVSMLPVLALGASGHGRGTALLLALLVVPAVGGTVAVLLAQRRRQRRVARRTAARWRAHLADVRTRAATAADEQRLALDRLHPADLMTAVRSGLAFERRPGDDDALTVSVGTGPVPALRPVLAAVVGPLEEVDPELAAAADAAERETSSVPAAVVSVSLRAVGVLAVVGPPEAVRPVLARIVGELAVLHAPGELALGGVGVPWLGRLPHARGGPATAAELAGWRPTTPLAVTVVAGYAPGTAALDAALDRARDAARASASTAAALASVAGFGPGSGAGSGTDAGFGAGGSWFAAVVACGSAADVPAAAGAVLDVGDRVLRTQAGERRLDAVAGLVDPGPLCAALAAAVPDVRSAALDLAALLARPREQELEVPIGLDATGGPVLLRLAEGAAGGDGPHGLLVGATGSGKSVLLRTIVAGLAARHSPTELALLLIDFKGGAAFADLAALPHCGGLVTNLADEPALLGRVATAIGAELDRRQRLLREAGVESRAALVADGSLDGPQAVGGAEAGAMPALLIAVDEAGELLAADPDMATVFARVGRVGRSLGVHLLLATQHWDGGRLRALDAHLRYRLCLRTFTADDSRAVLGTDAAVHLPGRSGAGYVAVDGVTRRVDVLPPPAAPLELVPPWPGVTDPVWLPSLPAALPWPADGSIGLLDRPDRRQQPPLVIDLDGAGGHVAVAGGPRSGVTTALRAVVHAACAKRGPAHLHVHVLDLTGGLGELDALPQVGTVAGLHQGALVRAVVTAVRTELARRSAGGATGPRLLLVVDGVGLLRSDDGAVEDALAEIAVRGLAHDVHLILGVRRWSELRDGLFDACGTRLELRLGDTAESLAGRARASRVPGVPGRGLLPDGTELQVALPDDAALPTWPGRVRPITLLPTAVAEPAVAAPATPSDRFALGLATPGPVRLDLLAPGRHLLVGGDTGSGRSTVLRRLVRHVSPRDHVSVVVLDPRRRLRDLASPTASRAGGAPGSDAVAWAHAPDPAAALLELLVVELRRRLTDVAADVGGTQAAARADPGAGADPADIADAETAPAHNVVVVDDYDLLVDLAGHGGPLTAALADLAALLPFAADVGLHLVVARPAAYRSLDPLTQRLRSAAPYVLQLPGEHLEGPAAGRAAPTVVGRGLLSRGGGPATEVQCYQDPSAAPGH